MQNEKNSRRKKQYIAHIIISIQRSYSLGIANSLISSINKITIIAQDKSIENALECNIFFI